MSHRITFMCERPGVISDGICWLAVHECWLYCGETLDDVLWQIYNEWQDDRHLAG